MIVKVKFQTSNSMPPTVVLFGDSYKRWQQQYVEYRRLLPAMVPVEVQKSRAEWVGWGGLKWCSEEEMQRVLNREGCQEGEPDAIAPRVYASFKFEPMSLGKLPI